MQTWRTMGSSLRLGAVLLVAIGCAIALHAKLETWSDAAGGGVVALPTDAGVGQRASDGDEEGLAVLGSPAARLAVSGMSAALGAPAADADDGGPTRGLVHDPDGRPIDGARIAVVEWSPRAMFAPPVDTDRAHARATTDAQGRFEFSGEGAWPATLVAWAQHDAFPSARFGPCSRAELEGAVIRFERGDTFRGAVVDAAGARVAGAQVLLIAPSIEAVLELDFAREPIDVLRTGADGRFESVPQPDRPLALLAIGPDGVALARGLRPGTGDLLLRLEPGVQVRGQLVDAVSGAPVEGRLGVPALPGWTASSDAAGHFALRLPFADERSRARGWDVVVRSNSHLEAQRVVQSEALGVVWRLDPRPRLCGRAFLSDGRPAAGAWLELDDPAAAGADGPAFVVDEAGEFDWPLPRELRSETLRVRHASDQHARIGPLSLASGEPSKAIDVHLSAPSQTTGLVRDAGGQPLADVLVEAFGSSAGNPLAQLSAKPERRARTEGDGTFALRLDRERSWTLRFSRPGFRSEVLETTPSSPSRLDIVLRAGGLLAGRVFDEDGTPVAGVEVVRIDKLGVASTRTTAAGEFRFDGVAALDQALACESGEHVPFLERGLRPDQGELFVQLTRGAFVRGHVFDGQSAAPLTSFEITRVRIDPGADELDQLIGELALPQSSEDGTFEVGPLAPGSYLLRIDVPGFTPWESGELVVAHGRGVDGLSVPMQRGLTFDGLVLDPHGDPVPNAEVRLYAATDPTSALQRRREARTGLRLRSVAAFETGSRGRCRRRGLAPGAYYVVVEADGFLQFNADVELPSAAGQLEFRLASALSVSGTAWFGDGTPAAAATVFTQGESEAAGGPFFVTARTRADGGFELEGLDPEQSYRIVANVRDPATGDFRVGTQTIELGRTSLQDVTMIIP